jgi:hypothetical protein
MWHRLNREDLVEAAPHFLELPGEMPFTFMWTVYKEYELVEAGDQPYLRTASNRIKHTYRPLIDSPHLFLEFARLVEQRDPGEALKEWISRRGLLGFHKRERSEEEINWWNEYIPEGGPSERWSGVVEEAISANRTLRYWEAVLSRNPERAEQELVGPIREDFLEYCRVRANEHGLTYSETLLYLAASMACHHVESVLEAFAFPYPAFDYRHSSERQSGPPGPELVSGSWQPRNLLGAMYLQMYQLMISSGKLNRCRHCGRIFSDAPPIPGSKERKTHKNKKFCDDRCRQNYHYHNVIKPKRNGTRNQ